MSFNTDSIVVVTGGTGALGRVITSGFLHAGFRVAVPVFHEVSDLKDLPAEWDRHHSRLLLRRVNLSQEEEVVEFLSYVSLTFGPPSIVVNTAGGYAGGNPVESISHNEWTGMLDGNLTSTFHMCKHTLPGMKEHSFGRIVNIAAMPALLPSKNRAAYAVAKRGVVTLTESIAEETKGLGITANAIAPSIMVTPANVKSMPEANVQSWVTPDEVAGLVLYLCSHEARSISGNTIKIFGGV